MTPNANSLRGAFRLRIWSKSDLQREDYLFAAYSPDASPNGKTWRSVAGTWAKEEQARCFQWELRREFARSKSPPYCTVVRDAGAIQQGAETSPSQLPALHEIGSASIHPAKPSSAAVKTPCAETTVRCFEIDLLEDTETTTQRFANWLVAVKAQLRKNGLLPMHKRGGRTACKAPASQQGGVGQPPSRRPALVEVASGDQLCPSAVLSSVRSENPSVVRSVLIIQLSEKTQVTIQRFKNWLVLRKVSEREDQLGVLVPGRRYVVAFDPKNPSHLTRQTVRNGLHRFQASFAASMRELLPKLQALAVRRLKQAGFTRHEAELRLGLPPGALRSNDWQRKCEQAVTIIAMRIEAARALRLDPSEDH